MSDVYPLSNEALQRDRSVTLLGWLIGSHTQITFHECHLGLVEDRGLAALARKYGLTGAFLALLFTAGLFVWHRVSLFVPPAIESPELALTYHQTAGLEALLRRAVAPAELIE